MSDENLTEDEINERANAKRRRHKSKDKILAKKVKRKADC